MALHSQTSLSFESHLRDGKGTLLQERVQVNVWTQSRKLKCILVKKFNNNRIFLTLFVFLSERHVDVYKIISSHCLNVCLFVSLCCFFSSVIALPQPYFFFKFVVFLLVFPFCCPFVIHSLSQARLCQLMVAERQARSGWWAQLAW